MPSIDARRFGFIRATALANLGPKPWDARVVFFAAALLGCAPTTAPSDAHTYADDTSSGGEQAVAPSSGYSEVEPGVFAREGELEGVSFLEVVLGATDPDAVLPLLVVIHGFGGRPDIPIGPYRELSRPVRFVLPRGPLVVGQGFAWMSVRVADGQPAALSSQLDVQTERLARFLTALRDARPALGATVVIGFSQGGTLTLALGTRHPALVGLALPLAGWLPPQLRVDAEEGAPRFVWMHGTADDRIPFALAQEASEDLRARGFDLTLVPYEGAGHAMSDAMDAAFHAWLERVLANVEGGRALGDGLPLP